MRITRTGSQTAKAGPPEWFTGTVCIEAPISTEAPARLVGASVSFAPGARTNWHSHPLGQTLIITSGTGRAAHAGGPVEALYPGDIIWFPPGERHWHGAAPDSAMTHLALHEADAAGRTVDWQEAVSDADYQA